MDPRTSAARLEAVSCGLLAGWSWPVYRSHECRPGLKQYLLPFVLLHWLPVKRTSLFVLQIQGGFCLNKDVIGVSFAEERGPRWGLRKVPTKEKAMKLIQ